MPTDAEQIATIKSQTLAVIADLTANPKPNYEVDGQKVAWGDYLVKLRSTVDWCNSKLVEETPFEQQSIGFSP